MAIEEAVAAGATYAVGVAAATRFSEAYATVPTPAGASVLVPAAAAVHLSQLGAAAAVAVYVADTAAAANTDPSDFSHGALRRQLGHLRLCAGVEILYIRAVKQIAGRPPRGQSSR